MVYQRHNSVPDGLAIKQILSPHNQPNHLDIFDSCRLPDCPTFEESGKSEEFQLKAVTLTAVREKLLRSSR